MKNINSVTSCLLLISALFFSCKKNTINPEEENQTPNWEIVKNFPQSQSYNSANLHIHLENPFVTTFGHFKLNNYSTLNNTFEATFFHQTNGSWYATQRPEEAVIALKTFNGELLGIRERKTIYTTYPVIQYQHSYILFKWENADFTDIDTLEYTNPNLLEKSDIGQITLWENNGKLHLIGTTAHTAKVWILNNNQFEIKPEELNLSFTNVLATDNEEVAFTEVIQTIISPDRTSYKIRGHYYDGSSFTSGQRYEFIIEDDTGFSNKDAVSYHAVKGNIWGFGYQGNAVKNYDNNQIVKGISDELIMRGDRVAGKDGKVYVMLGKKGNAVKCNGLAVFDGIQLTEVPFILPDILDPCSQLIDAAEYQGKIYLLLNNKGQYVVVRNI